MFFIVIFIEIAQVFDILPSLFYEVYSMGITDLTLSIINNHIINQNAILSIEEIPI